jgi:photosystem I subunit X
MVVSIALTLGAARFGLAPTANRSANAALKLSDNKSGIMSADPAGFTAVDVLAMGTAGHILGIGIVLGLKGTGAL